MKKYLIALPLVLIMILSMVPVMAANTINVEVKYYNTPDMKNIIKTENRAVEVTDAELKDVAALKAKVKEAIKGFGFPVLDTDNQPAWEVEVTAKAQSQDDPTYSAAEVKTPSIKVTELKTWAENNKVPFTIDLTESQLAARPYASIALMTEVNHQVRAIIAGNKPAEVVATYDKVQEKETNNSGAKLVQLVVTEGDVHNAEASAVAYPKCFVDPKAPVEKWCPELCTQITVKIWDVYSGEVLNKFTRVYDVNKFKLPSYDGILNHYRKNYFPGYAYQILTEWNGAEAIYKPYWVQNDCTIWINVVPLVQEVNVLHTLLNCCETPDGKVSYPVWKQFWEEGVTVPFITFHSTPVVDEKTAAEWASTRLQKINATDFVFQKAEFIDGINLDGYMLGNVYDVYGRLVEEITNDDPMIEITYLRSECVKDEEKVDNATVENNANTQAPVTASGTQLPATGAKDVTAFFLSAVALLGLGIFFAKKH